MIQKKTIRYLQLWVLHKIVILIAEKQIGIIRVLNSEKRQEIPHFLSDKGFKFIVVNRTLLCLHGWVLEIPEITLTFPLIWSLNIRLM